MDRKSAKLIASFGAALALTACAASTQQISVHQVSLRETAWLADDGRLEALARARHIDREALYSAALSGGLADSDTSREQLRADLLAGEFLFKAPLLLGGQAAKAGISCHSCHVNGTDNPHFQFPAISGDPGTADTTHSFFSQSLGNGVFDPIAIPDLTREGRVDHARSNGELEAFLTMIVVGEFSGKATSPAVIVALATYVRALRLLPQGEGLERRAHDIMLDIEDLQHTLDQARLRAGRGQVEMASLLLSSAQSQSQFIYERLHLAHHEDLRRWLASHSRKLGALRQRLNAGEKVPQAEFATLQEALRAAPDFAPAQQDSLYNLEMLSQQF